MDKSEVDSFTSGTVLPGFELKLKWTQPDRPPEFLKHPLVLHGARGDIYFTLYISDPGMTVLALLLELRDKSLQNSYICL